MGTNLGPNVARLTKEDAGRSEIVIAKSRDGHFYVAGSINAIPVTFLIDTGAGVVTIGSDLARQVGLSGGDPVQLDTAGGVVAGEMLSGVAIVAGGFRIEGLRVAVSPTMRTNYALLGQNFLRHLRVTQHDDQMVLRVAPGR